VFFFFSESVFFRRKPNNPTRKNSYKNAQLVQENQE